MGSVGGDYFAKQYFYKAVKADVDVATADTSKTAIIAPFNSSYTIYVQRIVISVITDAAQSLIFQDNAGSPVIIAKTKASPGLGPIIIDFGPQGTPLTAGKQLDIATSGAGLAARVHVEGYQVPSTQTVGTNN